MGAAIGAVLCGAAGLILIVGGVAMIYPPAAFILAGCVLLFVGRVSAETLGGAE